MNNKTPDEIIEALERLQRLKEAGLLSDEEVAQQKAEILTKQRAASGRAPSSAEGLSVRPETLKKISESNRSNGGLGALWAILAVGVFVVGGYFGAQALNIQLLEPPKRPFTASLISLGGGYAVDVQSRAENVTITGARANKGQCVLANPTKEQKEWAKSIDVKGLTSSKVNELLRGTDVSYSQWSSYRTFSALPANLKMGEKLRLIFRGCNLVEAEIEWGDWMTTIEF